jgi:uncharacterized membrane protein YbhN (UPF0104 family)
MIGWWLRALSGPVLVVLVLLAVEPRDTLALMRNTAPGWILAAFAALTAQTMLSALRWQLTASRLGLRLSFRHALSEYYIAQTANQLLPGGVFGDVGRAVRVSGRVGLRCAGASVLLERLAGQAGLGAVGLGLLGVTLTVPSGVIWAPWSVGMTTVLCATPLALLGGPRLLGCFDKGKRIARLAYRALLAPGLRWRHTVLSVLAAMLNIAAFAFCAAATGTEASLFAVAAVAPLVLGAMLVPASVAGLGLREGAAAALWPLMLGAAPAAGAAAGLAFGAVFIAASLFGAGAAIALKFLAGSVECPPTVQRRGNSTARLPL